MARSPCPSAAVWSIRRVPKSSISIARASPPSASSKARSAPPRAKSAARPCHCSPTSPRIARSCSRTSTPPDSSKSGALRPVGNRSACLVGYCLVTLQQGEVMASRSLRATERWWFSVAILGPAVAVLAVIAAATLAFVLWTAQGVDQRSLERQNELARKVIELQLARVPHDQQSITIWDDAITHTKLSFDASWVDTNLGTWMHSYFGHDEVLILDDKDRPVYDMLSGGQTALRHAEAQLHDLLPFVATLRAEIAAGAIDRYHAGTDATPPALSDLAVINGGPMLLSSSPLISDSG